MPGSFILQRQIGKRIAAAAAKLHPPSAFTEERSPRSDVNQAPFSKRAPSCTTKPILDFQHFQANTMGPSLGMSQRPITFFRRGFFRA
ncbi:hypothetical protein KM043_016423 [Ampulex compressa]|nr:hypothetical protein KM043_016423 [Ampulex compressa]